MHRREELPLKALDCYTSDERGFEGDQPESLIVRFKGWFCRKVTFSIFRCLDLLISGPTVYRTFRYGGSRRGGFVTTTSKKRRTRMMKMQEKIRR